MKPAIAIGDPPGPNASMSSRFKEYLGQRILTAILGDPRKMSLERDNSNEENSHAKRMRNTEEDLLAKPQSTPLTADSGRADSDESDFESDVDHDDLDAVLQKHLRSCCWFIRSSNKQGSGARLCDASFHSPYITNPSSSAFLDSCAGHEEKDEQTNWVWTARVKSHKICHRYAHLQAPVIHY